MTRVNVKGGSLHTQVDRKDEQAPWLLLSNGICTDHSIWDGQIALFSQRFNVIRYDTRGHGDSDAIGGDYSFDDLVDDVESILDHYGVKRATMLGVSLGGMTGMGFALRNPARLDALVCCNARADAPEPFVKSWDDRMAVIAKNGMASIAGGTIERWVSPATREAHPVLAERLAAMIGRTSPAGFAGCAAALKRLNFLKDLPSLSGRALFVSGTDDAGAPPPVMEAMAKATPGAQFAVIPQCAHISNVDNPAGFREAVSPFLSLA